MWKRSVPAVGLVALTATTSGCALLALAAMLFSPDLLGVSPSSDYSQTGNLEFSLLPKSEDGDVVLGSLEDGGVDILVENEDGTYSECETVDEDTVRPSEYNTLAVLMDSSGSMERAYPEEEFGDFCLTCPHDVNRNRIRAARAMVNRLLERVPGTQVALMDFGPASDAGRQATRLLQGFTTDGQAFGGALDLVEGAEMAGTPLYDALAEVIGECTQVSDDYEEELLALGLIGSAVEPDGGLEPSFGGDDGEVQDDPFEPTAAPARDTDGVRRFILVVSDGEDMNSEYYDLESVIQLAIQSDVVIHAIGLGVASATYENPLARSDEQARAVSNLQRLAEATGGYYAAVRDSDALVEMTRDLADSLSEGYARTTQACVPVDTAGEPLALTSGDRMRGIVRSESGVEVPWTVLVP
jgi:hypothetical protein